MPSPSPPRDAPTEPREDRKRQRSRSRSPRRSRSPAPRKPKSYSGLKWKNDRRDDRRREGGERGDRRDDRRGDRRDDRERRDDVRRDDRRDDRRGDRRDDRRDDRRRYDKRDDRRRDDKDQVKDRRDFKPSKPPTTAAPATTTPSEPMILITVNDRLGTKTQVPCLPSDPIKFLKAMVAAKIGRPVHEIMLKRQGERPFHDNLSCADYGISNGVQIDLELNTGD